MSGPDGFDSLFVAAPDGLALHVRDYGPRATTTTPVVCLPGLTRNAADFHDLALHLSRDARRPRRVVSLDFRGRGRSARDADWRRYDPRVELDDVLAVATALGIARALFVGTSRGGLVTMGLAAARPTLVAGAVLNDIGPVLEPKGLMRIRSYVGKMPAPRDMADAVVVLRRLFDAQFPKLDDAQWAAYARGTWRETPAGLVPDYDPALMKPLAMLDLEAPLPAIWPLFEALAGVPVLSIRGGLSDLLSATTVAEMGQRHLALDSVMVPDQGHAPLLTSRDLLTRIARMAGRLD